jgi:hypothetical protein
MTFRHGLGGYYYLARVGIIRRGVPSLHTNWLKMAAAAWAEIKAKSTMFKSRCT